MNGGRATLPTVTDVDPPTAAPDATPGPALTPEEIVRLTGGVLLARSDRPIRGAEVRLCAAKLVGLPLYRGLGTRRA